MAAHSNRGGEKRLSMDKCFQDFERGACAGDQRCKDEVSKLVEPQQYSLLDWSKSGDLIAVVAFGQASTCDDKPSRLANDAAIFRISSTASRLQRRLLPMKRQISPRLSRLLEALQLGGNLSSVKIWERWLCFHAMRYDVRRNSVGLESFLVVQRR